MSGKSARIVGVFLTLCLASFLAGCNLAPPPQEKQVRKTKKVPIEKVIAVETPADWPEEAPLYPQAELESATVTPAGLVLTLKTEDRADKIFNWYYDELEARKWAQLGPTLDVAQNIAVIKAKLGEKQLYLEARTSETAPGMTALTLTSSGQ